VVPARWAACKRLNHQKTAIGNAAGKGKTNVAVGAVVQGQAGMLRHQSVNIGNN